VVTGESGQRPWSSRQIAGRRTTFWLESSSFLKKRTKKLLRLGGALPERAATATQKSFASFLQKRRLSLLA
jgi:hypothetical protein